MFEILFSPRMLALLITFFSVIALLCALAYATERKKRRARAGRRVTQNFVTRRPAHVFRILSN